MLVLNICLLYVICPSDPHSLIPERKQIITVFTVKFTHNYRCEVNKNASMNKSSSVYKPHSLFNKVKQKFKTYYWRKFED